MENALQVQRGASWRVCDRRGANEFLAHRRFDDPGSSPDVLTLAANDPYQTPRRLGTDRSRTVLPASLEMAQATTAKTVPNLGPCISGLLETASAWRQASRVRLPQQLGDAPVFERLRTQRSHSLSGRGLMCNTTWRAASAAVTSLMALPRRGRTGPRPIPWLQSIPWIHWFESWPPEMAHTTVRRLQLSR